MLGVVDHVELRPEVPGDRLHERLDRSIALTLHGPWQAYDRRYSQVSWSTLHGMSRLLIDGVYLDSAAMGPMCDQTAAMFWNELRNDQ